jgi:hypothetical protein
MEVTCGSVAAVLKVGEEVAKTMHGADEATRAVGGHTATA